MKKTYNYEAFENYISTHFSENVDFSKKRLDIEFNQFDNNFIPILPEKKKIKILEIGFGTGYFIKYLLDKGYNQIDGIEISPEVTEFVKKKIYNNVECVADTEIYLAGKPGQYDLIVMLDVLEHVQKDQVFSFLKQIKSALKKEGAVVARVPNGANPFNAQIFNDDFTHEFFYTAESLKQVFKISGFDNIVVNKWREENITLHSKITNITSILLAPLLKIQMGLMRVYFRKDNYLSRNILVHARK